MKQEEKGSLVHALNETRTSVRRTFLKIILAFSGGTALRFATAPVRAETSKIKEEELAPFRKIAKEKGVELNVVAGDSKPNQAISQMHLDMDMVRASLRNAIDRAKQQGLASIQARLERLLASGTAAQQVDFVLGSGNRYFFPEDVEKYAAMAEKNKLHSFQVRCTIFCFLACLCTADFTQECRERCRELC